MPVSTASYSECGWRSWLNGTTITLGINNVFDANPPFAGGGVKMVSTKPVATLEAASGTCNLRKDSKLPNQPFEHDLKFPNVAAEAHIRVARIKLEIYTDRQARRPRLQRSFCVPWTRHWAER